MSAGGEHGALGSNKKLERVPVPEPEISKDLDENDEVPTSSATEIDDGDVVYLREDLRPS